MKQIILSGLLLFGLVMSIQFLPHPSHIFAATTTRLHAQTGNNVVTMPTVTSSPNSSGTFAIPLQNSEAVASGEIRFIYDATIGLDITNVVAGSRAGGFTVSARTNSDNPSQTIVSILFFNLGNLTIPVGSGPLLEVAYTTTSTASGTTALEITETILSDAGVNSLNVTTVDGIFTIQSTSPTSTPTPAPTGMIGDCNSDDVIDAGDLAADVLEIFDGDGTSSQDAPGGTFAGTTNCDANQDSEIDAGDISCTLLVIFNTNHNCTAGSNSAGHRNAVTLTIDHTAAVTTDDSFTVPLHLATNGNTVNAAALALHFDPSRLTVDPTNAVTVTQAAGQVQVTAQVNATSNELILSVVDPTANPTAFTDGLWMMVTFDVQTGTDGNTLADTVRFSENVPTSFGSIDGESLPVITRIESTQNTAIYLPLILSE